MMKKTQSTSRVKSNVTQQEVELLRRKLLGDGPGPPMRASHLVSFETVAELLIGYV